VVKLTSEALGAELGAEDGAKLGAALGAILGANDGANEGDELGASVCDCTTEGAVAKTHATIISRIDSTVNIILIVKVLLFSRQLVQGRQMRVGQVNKATWRSRFRRAAMPCERVLWRHGQKTKGWKSEMGLSL